MFRALVHSRLPASADNTPDKFGRDRRRSGAIDRMLAVCAFASSAALLPDAPRTGRRAVLRGAASAAMLPSIAWAQQGVPEGMKTSESYAAGPATPCHHPRSARPEQRLSYAVVSSLLDAAPASFRAQVHEPTADLSGDNRHARRLPELTRTPRGLRTVREGYAHRPHACRTYRRRREACPGGHHCTRTSLGLLFVRVPCTVAPQALAP